MNRILRRVMIELCVFVAILTIPVWYPIHVIRVMRFKPDPHLARIRRYIMLSCVADVRDDATMHRLNVWRSQGETPAQRVEHLERLLAFRANPVLP